MYNQIQIQPSDLEAFEDFTNRTEEEELSLQERTRLFIERKHYGFEQEVAA